MSRIEAFGEAVRACRADLGLSQESLAFRSGLDRTYISGIERGIRNPTLRTIFKIADALDTSPAILLGKAQERLNSLT